MLDEDKLKLYIYCSTVLKVIKIFYLFTVVKGKRIG